MDLGSIFLILAGLVLIIVFVSRPFLDRKVEEAALLEQKTADQEQHRHSVLLAERDRLLTAIQELDFDHTLGKIPAEDYPAQRELLLQNGIAILKELDNLDKVQLDQSVEERLEQAIDARRAVAALPDLSVDAKDDDRAGSGLPARPRRADATARLRIPAASTDDLEALIAARRQSRQEKTAGFCPQCGKPVLLSDRYCSYCGTQVAAR